MEADREVQSEDAQTVGAPTLAELDALFEQLASELRAPSPEDGWFKTTDFLERYKDIGSWVLERRLTEMVDCGELETVKHGRDRYYRVPR